MYINADAPSRLKMELGGVVARVCRQGALLDTVLRNALHLCPVPRYSKRLARQLNLEVSPELFHPLEAGWAKVPMVCQPLDWPDHNRLKDHLAIRSEGIAGWFIVRNQGGLIQEIVKRDVGKRMSRLSLE